MTKAQSIVPVFATRPTLVGVLLDAASCPRTSESHVRRADLQPGLGEGSVGLSRGESKKYLSWIGFAVPYSMKSKKVVGSLSPQVKSSNACFASKVAKASSFAVIVRADIEI
uniref:Uncharacterized protein n=1 Tax=uncultured gamma proteobacterium HF0010_05D02 TaxID=710978 RepID=E0XQL2_9GAMM|nr:hypothetical protein [uncultured gamma proteobacterium HF0010_05D02]